MPLLVVSMSADPQLAESRRLAKNEAIQLRDLRSAEPMTGDMSKAAVICVATKGATQTDKKNPATDQRDGEAQRPPGDARHIIFMPAKAA